MAWNSSSNTEPVFIWMEVSQFTYLNTHIPKDLIDPVLRKPTGTVKPHYEHKTKQNNSVFLQPLFAFHYKPI